jgi:hypothetical protein
MLSTGTVMSTKGIRILMGRTRMSTGIRTIMGPHPTTGIRTIMGIRTITGNHTITITRTITYPRGISQWVA